MPSKMARESGPTSSAHPQPSNLSDSLNDFGRMRRRRGAERVRKHPGKLPNQIGHTPIWGPGQGASLESVYPLYTATLPAARACQERVLCTSCAHSSTQQTLQVNTFIGSLPCNGAGLTHFNGTFKKC
eukprot:942841-Amphidinium_carterae.1